uniref:Ribonuclease H2 subunit B wHTH domain-containing protein n=1 Tax=Trypanosoma congolense (strain IL3000) TaxID=1068625 RepID=G0UJ54_TRYCI|nr:conserved hypothetical protein [Trypanosoma congolense IL3000]
MQTTKRGRPSSVSRDDGKAAATAPRSGSNPPSSCSSDVGSLRRKLDPDDEGSQSMLSNISQVGACSGSARYDQDDHTTPLPSGGYSSYLIALPCVLLKCAADGYDQIRGGIDVVDREHMDSPSYATRGSGMVSPQSPSNATAAACSLSASPGVPWRLGNASLCRSSAFSLRDGCNFVRLPHPRHGEPMLFLCPPSTSGTSDAAARREPVLYEVQAQSPPGGFGQTWLVGDMVEPNEDLLTVVPFDCTFLALRQASGHAVRDKFLSAEDLIMGPLRSGYGGNAWPGWGVTLKQCPELAPAVGAMQSDVVLSRICEVRAVGDDKYYRFSAEKMGAWLQGKVRRVAECPALRAMLHLDEDLTQAVPLPVAFGVVAEYVPQELCGIAAELCGSVDASS